LCSIFCLLVNTAFCANSPPQNISLSPKHVNSFPNKPRILSTTSQDQDGCEDLSQIYLLIHHRFDEAASFSAYYDQRKNKLYLRDDTGTNWLGGFSPGSQNILANSFSFLDCSQTSVSSTGNSLVIKWAIAFKGTPGDKWGKSIFLKAVDVLGNQDPWRSFGSWQVEQNHLPEVLSLEPTRAKLRAGQQLELTATYQDEDGWEDLKQVQLEITSQGLKEHDYLLITFQPATQSIWLNSASQTATLGSKLVLENAVAKLDCAASFARSNEDTLTLRWSLSFKPIFASSYQKKITLLVEDKQQARSQAEKGSLFIEPSLPANKPPRVEELSPARVFSKPNDFIQLTTTFSDPDGSQDLKQLALLFSDEPYEQDGFYAYYLPGTNQLYLRSKKKTTPGASPGSSNLLENDFGQLDCSQTRVSTSLNSLTISWALKPKFLGQRHIYLAALDKKGSSTEWQEKGSCFISAPGVLGAQGGEVSSSDARVKLVVPPGAVNQETLFVLLPQQPELFQPYAPPEHQVVAVVECKATGHLGFFRKPLQLTFNLHQPEIPGTLLKLFRFDAQSKQFSPTGDTYSLGVDSYKAVFSLKRFSTYALLKPTISTPIGLGVKIPLPDLLTGAFSHSLPLTLPPGRRGMQPALSLNYRSSNANSWTGVGFSLNPGYITRSTRLGPPSYNDSQDTFYFITDSGTTELVHLVDNLYQAKIESSFSRFFKEKDDSWQLLAKDGSQAFFGQTQEAKETGSSATFSWYLTKTQDTNGNYISYSYIKDSGKSYLSRIDYTGHTSGIQPTNSVEFFLEARTDVPSSYISGAKIATRKRLKEIEVRVKQDLVWRYVLDYGNYSSDTGRSLLRSVTQYASDGKEFPKQGFDYQAAK
jgi:hypothetical protein